MNSCQASLQRISDRRWDFVLDVSSLITLQYDYFLQKARSFSSMLFFIACSLFVNRVSKGFL